MLSSEGCKSSGINNNTSSNWLSSRRSEILKSNGVCKLNNRDWRRSS